MLYTHQRFNYLKVCLRIKIDLAYYSNSKLPLFTQVPVAYYAKSDDGIYKLKKYTDEVPIKTTK
jgi:hypothetical protein